MLSETWLTFNTVLFCSQGYYSRIPPYRQSCLKINYLLPTITRKTPTTTVNSAVLLIFISPSLPPETRKWRMCTTPHLLLWARLLRKRWLPPDRPAHPVQTRSAAVRAQQSDWRGSTGVADFDGILGCGTLRDKLDSAPFKKQMRFYRAVGCQKD